jgi:chromatin segregation and condensation protein Rec8/ScpA/Scc1 (kleisin family)
VLDLSQGYQRIAGPIDFSRLGDHRVEIDDTPTALFQEDLLDRLQHAPGGRLSLQEVFHGHGRTQRIGLFLAALELVRLRQVSVEQPDIDGPIELVMAGEEA